MDNVSANPLVLDPLPSALVPALKPCARCTEQKPWHDFNHRQGTKDGKQSYCRLCQQDDHLLRAYNLTRQERDLMYERQRGQCAVCQGSHPQLYIHAFEGVGVISLVCPRCRRICNGFNHNPDIITSAIDYLNYFGSKALYRVEQRVQEDWQARHTGEPPRRTRRRHYPRGVNEETYEHWSLLNDHTCYICGEPCPTDHGRNDCQRGRGSTVGVTCL